MMFNPPYYAVIFTSRRCADDKEGYQQTAQRMLELAAQQEGFLHADSVRDPSGFGITVSYWRDPAAIARWRQQAEHVESRRLGKEKWYSSYEVRVCKVEREYKSEVPTGE